MNQDFTKVVAGFIVRLVDDTVPTVTAEASHKRNPSAVHWKFILCL